MQELKYKNIVNSGVLIFVLLISFDIPLYRWILPYFALFWGVFSLARRDIFELIKKSLKSSFKRNIILLQILFFMFFIVGYFLSYDKHTAFDVIGRKAALIFFPFLFLITGSFLSKSRILILKFFVLGNFVASVFCYIVAFYHSINIINGEITFNPVLQQTNNYFNYVFFSVFQHPGYFSMYIVFSLAILLYFKEKKIIFNSRNTNVLFYFLLLFFVLTIALLLSRVGIFSLIVFFFWGVLERMYKYKSRILKISVSIIFGILLFFIAHTKRISNTLVQFGQIYNKHSVKIKPPTRLILWETSLELIKENVLLGYGTGDYLKIFVEKYAANKNSERNHIGNNVHNQFLEIFVSSGILSVIVLLSIFIYSAVYSFMRRNYLFFSLILIVFFNFLFETMLNTLAGVFFFSFFLNYFVFVFNVEKIDNKEILKINSD